MRPEFEIQADTKRRVVFIGDVHGKVPQLLNILRTNKDCLCIQVGDLGVGFKMIGTNYDPTKIITDRNFRFIRGNHDNPQECETRFGYLGDYGYHQGLFWMGGADSVDKAFRTEGVTWWRDEELGMKELGEALDLYTETRPEVVVTHTCPSSVLEAIHSHHAKAKRTEQALQAMFEIHKPRLWVFGHHHKSWEHNIEGCRFRCLGELEATKTDLELRAWT